jgi:hypothetical protein
MGVRDRADDLWSQERQAWLDKPWTWKVLVLLSLPPVLPLQFKPGDSADSLGLDGTETFTVTGLTGEARVADTLTVHTYHRHGGVLPYVLRTVLDRETQ